MTSSPTTMTTTEWMELENRSQLGTYNKWPIALVGAKGAMVTDTDGRTYLDLYGGHCVAFLGHNHPKVVAAIKQQADEILFYSNAVYSPARAKASERLARLAPDGMDTVFFVSTGTEANEVAMKIARKATGRTNIVAVEGDFHGRTLGSLAATWEGKYRSGYEESFGPVTFVPFDDAEQARKVILEQKPAAVIVEPIQSMSGMKTASVEYFQALESACRETGAMFIMDEVQTGVGRTGAFTYADLLGIKPDMITLAKSLGGGVPVAAVLVRDEVAATVHPGEQGTTFGGGMLAMAAVDAALQVVEEEHLSERALAIWDALEKGCVQRGLRCQGAGCLMGIDFGQPVGPIVAALRAEGILTGGSANPNIMRLMPPAVVSDEQISGFFKALDLVMEQVVA
ncbi:MAG: aminotransferase class III-fold pyridoxal phosphate-dependent enzyme [Bacteroidetes bacterium]|nr:aminotransferase class III-fold pyridoxal phosphate-dependent enzyme [Bacteroidota bacterium]